MQHAPPSVDVAIRLADEGVPLRAIARATQISSSLLYETLNEAQRAGRLLELPRADWPPGCPRDQRALQLSRLVNENRPALLLAIRQLFRMTRIHADMMLHLVQHPIVLRDNALVDRKCFDVHICKIRRLLAPFDIRILTVWGSGHCLSDGDRRRAMDLILARLGAPG